MFHLLQEGEYLLEIYHTMDKKIRFKKNYILVFSNNTLHSRVTSSVLVLDSYVFCIIFQWQK